MAKFHFPTDEHHMRILTDDMKEPHLRPTRENLIKAFHWLVDGATAGMSLFLHYSGHGGTQEDKAPDTDEVDGQDETLIPVDYESNGVIVDDELHDILVAKLPQGVRLTCIFDCCHSGSILDLPYTYTIDGNLDVAVVDNRKAAMEAAIAAGMAFIQGDKSKALAKGMEVISKLKAPPQAANSEAQKKAILIRSSLADVISWSGCRDEQTSADASIGGEATGAMSWAFREGYQPGLSYTDLLKHIRELLKGKYSQVPQLSTGHKMDMKSAFVM